MILDCVLFWREFDCLEIRFRELKDVVDTFVVVEAPWTHAGLERELVYPKRGRALAEAIGVDVHYVALSPHLPTMALQALMRDAPPDHKNLPWARENFQRQSIRDAVGQLVDEQEKNWVMISDCDEIPSAQAALTGKALCQEGAVVRFNQPLCYYYLNACLEPEPAPILCSRMVRYSRKDFWPQAIRRTNVGPVVSPGGWHFGWLGDADQAREKIEAFAHQEMNTEYILADGYLEWCIKAGKHPGEMRQIYRFPEEHLPACVREKNEFRRLFAPDAIPELSRLPGRSEAMDPWTRSHPVSSPVRGGEAGAGDGARGSQSES